MFGLIFASATFVRRDDAFDLWWQTGAPTVLIGIACGVAVYALTAVYGRALAIGALHPHSGGDAPEGLAIILSHVFLQIITNQQWSRRDSNPQPPPCKGGTLRNVCVNGVLRYKNLSVVRSAVLATEGAREVRFMLMAAG